MARRALQRVLYVEDDEDVELIVRLALERIGGMTFRHCGDSEAAIEAMLSFGPDLVILDWMMPAVDGVEVFQRMQAVPALAELPVVFLTAKVHWRETDYLKKLGVVGVIAKPFSAQDLSDNLRRIWDGLP
jgi:DNA-binding response OmpR family regulator